MIFKPRIHLILFALIGLVLTNANAQSTNLNISPRSIIVFSGNKDWSVEELTQLALKHLRKRADFSGKEKFEIGVYIGRNTNALCELSFTQGLGQRFWEVQFASDGSIAKVTSGIDTEGK